MSTKTQQQTNAAVGSSGLVGVNHCEKRKRKILLNGDYNLTGEKPEVVETGGHYYACMADEIDECKQCRHYTPASEKDEWCDHLFDEKGAFGDLCYSDEARRDTETPTANVSHRMETEQ